MNEQRIKDLEAENEREYLLELFKDFFTFHNSANKDFKGIDDLFNKWYGERQKVLKTLREQYGIEESKVKSISRRL